MKRFRNILYSPSNRSHDPAALRRVVELATRHSAKLTLLGVIKAPTPLQRLFDPTHRHDQATLEVRQELLDKLTAATEDIERIQVDVIVEVGRPGDAIVERVLFADHDLVVVDDFNPSPSPAVKGLLRKCPCPVWVLKPDCDAVQRVLAAVNPHPEEAELNRLILELASGLAADYGGELHVGHAWEVYGDAPDGTPFDFTEAIGFDQLRSEMHAAHENALREVLAGDRLADAPRQIHLVRGPADDVLPEIVRMYDIDLLVMGTIARPGHDGVFIGTTAERIIDEVECSVLAVKPPGFASPIHGGTQRGSPSSPLRSS